MATSEINFDGLIGPTHNYAGLSHGNVASASHRGQVSHPKQAALQGLAKMKLLADLGVRQAVLPPQERPDLATLRRMGFAGKDAQVVAQARREAPRLLAACCSASSMWAANAATVSPSADCADGRVHITVANLQSNLHRSLEAPFTERMLRRLFADERRFAVHPPLPATAALSDEGAANHTRLGAPEGGAGVELFVYGREDASAAPTTQRYPARQTLEASRAVARLHLLNPRRTLFAQQNPRAIDAGVFHNDVISVGNADVFFFHEQAFVDTPKVIAELRKVFERVTGRELVALEVPEQMVPLAEAVRTYLFNGQLVSLPDGTMTLVCPCEVSESQQAFFFLCEVGSWETPLKSNHFVELRQSMRNGGGPACLRLRVALTDAELARVHPGVMWTDALGGKLRAWVKKHYRDDLHPRDLADPKLIDEGRTALAALTRILDLPGLYAFQH